MSTKFKQAIKLIIILFISGNLIFFLGLTKGSNIAAVLLLPLDGNLGLLSNEMILFCTYMPTIIGGSLILLSLSFSTVVFINWIKIK